ncbi:type 1 glutamine amidotransferase domain-containing protein [Roseospira marina]|uniref:Type 1 glutamine amidotransferase domain-containing protein n=1 Tax=Roseospira marina TaxID=140057 RepID=A0A5M6I7I3_9PROT|nr:type 1 glutamine amidotransferase domain-containing protein [Roseospira marina]KAA5604093.1 type 1 glutamine amidotransferase domain-containing protein [Roseospira marina]MBB4315808.1 putative intracellular protease/amidase [Roseospira marina]MBB5088953.1 putative intracellular protease/amidase [Roseospira marina]
MSKKILTLLSDYGYWGVELTGPMVKLEAAGYDLVFATPKGQRPVALPPSYDTTYVDPPLGMCVTTPEDAEQVNSIKDSPKLDNPRALNDWIPERPYFSAENFLRKLEAYYARLKEIDGELAEYAGILLVGGSGPIVDMVNNQRVHDLILAFHRADKPIAAICYGVACLPMARDFNERTSIIRGKHVTGHCIEYDYHDGTGFIGTDFNMGPPPYCLEYMLTDAVGPEGQYHGNFGKHTSVIVDYPFITARSLQCSHEFGDQFVKVLDKGLRRYGW